mgnify:CR=1 FL=1
MFTYCPPKSLQDLQSTTFPDGKRYYQLPDGTRLPSVTTVIGAKGKQAILEWRKRVGEEVADKISKYASSRGTNVHTLCERYLNNEFGANLRKFIFEQITSGNLSFLKDSIQSLIKKYFTNIKVEKLEVVEVPGESNAIDVSLTYSIINTGIVDQVQITFT